MSQVELSVCGAPLWREEDSSKGTEKDKFGTGSKHYKFYVFGGGTIKLVDRKINEFLIIGDKTIILYNLVILKIKELKDVLFSCLNFI